MSDENEPLDDLPGEENDDASRTRRQHDLYQKAVNHPVRHRILELISASPRSENDLYSIVQGENLFEDGTALNYHLDYLLKANCISIEQDAESGERLVSITPGGQVIDYLK